ncbi:LysE family translocator [Cognatiyoonia sp.]|uniref:LysE family translocator n=1 Tax=Cognatiyoonia sp. TaxID=2211652 RepID=UPI003F69870C
MTLTAFFAIAAIHLAAAISPGPAFIVSLRVAAAEGFGPAAGLALGFGLGAATWAIAAMTGVAVLFELVPYLFVGLKLAGAAFVLFIACSMWRHAKEPTADVSEVTANPHTSWSAIRLGYLTFLSNPKSAVFFGAVFIGLVPPDTALGWKTAIVIIILINETLWYLIVAGLFSTEKARSGYRRAKVWIDRTFGTFLALLGMKIALT